MGGATQSCWEAIPPFSEGQNEPTVHFDSSLDRFLEIQTVRFGQADPASRSVDDPTGPWTPVERFYRPEEWAMPAVLVYVGKAPPHLTGADLVLTNATSTTPFARLICRNDLCYPQFLRVHFSNGWIEW